MLQYRGDTEYITRLERECEIVKKRLLSREKVIGFGCQWKGANKIGVIEIATPCTVYIFHVGAYKDRMTCNDEDDDDNNNNNNNNNTHSDGSDDEAKTNKKKLLHHKKKTVPSFLKCGESMFNLSGNNADIHLISHELRYLLESADYLKVGVNIHGDFMKLSADFDIQYDPHSILDLGAFYNTKLSLMEHWNVLSLCEQLLNGDVDRSNDIAKSEWSEFPLDDEQMRYCQETAYFALKLFFKIHSIKDNNDEESSQNEDYLTYNGIQENEYKDGYDLEYTFKDMQDDQDATDDEYDHDFDAIIMGKKLTNDIDISQIYASPINTNVRHNESDYFANIMCDDSPLISFMSPFNRHNDMEQIGKTSENTSTSLTQCGSSLKPMNLMGIIDKQSESAILIEDDVKSDCIEITDIMETQNHFLPKIRSVEVKHYRQMDCILSYWMWSWSDFIFPNRKMKDIEQQYMIHATGNVNKNTLSLKKKEVYKCFDDFGMDFDAIIECRGYALSYKQIYYKMRSIVLVYPIIPFQVTIDIFSYSDKITLKYKAQLLVITKTLCSQGFFLGILTATIKETIMSSTSVSSLLCMLSVWIMINNATDPRRLQTNQCDYGFEWNSISEKCICGLFEDGPKCCNGVECRGPCVMNCVNFDFVNDCVNTRCGAECDELCAFDSSWNVCCDGKDYSSQCAADCNKATNCVNRRCNCGFASAGVGDRCCGIFLRDASSKMCGFGGFSIDYCTICTDQLGNEQQYGNECIAACYGYDVVNNCRPCNVLVL